MEMMQQKIIYYDGDCGFCNKSVQFVLKYRKDDSMLFCPLQSDKASSVLAQFNVEISFETIYLLENGQLYDRSSAALRIARFLKFPVNLLFGFIIIPKIFRDPVYRLIAKYRHKLASNYCVIPENNEKKLFLN